MIFDLIVLIFSRYNDPKVHNIIGFPRQFVTEELGETFHM